MGAGRDVVVGLDACVAQVFDKCLGTEVLLLRSKPKIAPLNAPIHAKVSRWLSTRSKV